MDTTSAAQEMRAKREQELDSLKKSINEESTAHEAAMSNLRQKHSHLVEELNGQLESTKKVKPVSNVAFCMCRI
jgi:myosin protein heavy chain